MEQLLAIETSRASFVSNLREALHEQELKLDQVRTQIQAAKSQLEPAGNTSKQFVECNNLQLVAEKKLKDSSAAALVVYTRQISFRQICCWCLLPNLPRQHRRRKCSRIDAHLSHQMVVATILSKNHQVIILPKKELRLKMKLTLVVLQVF